MEAANKSSKYKLHYKICPICKVKFVARYKHRIYCSENCRDNKYLKSKGRTKKTFRKTCQLCKRPFYTKVPNQLYCSPECQREITRLKSRKRFWSVIRWNVLNRDNFTCQYCGRNPTQHAVVLHIDHIKPKIDGGKDELDNLVTACDECNSIKIDRPLRHEAKFKKRLTNSKINSDCQEAFTFMYKSIKTSKNAREILISKEVNILTN